MPPRRGYACDSFEGFPEEKVAVLPGLPFSSGPQEVPDVRRHPRRLQRFFEVFNVRGEIVQGYFSDTLPRFADTQFCFIHLDCDLYESYRECLHLLYDKLAPGGVVVFDDYKAPKWPGAEIAVDEFFASRPEAVAQCRDRSNPSWFVRK